MLPYKENFENIIPDELKGWFGGVYGWCAHDCLVATRRWYDAQGYRNPVQWIFEAGTIGYGQVHTMFDHLYKNQKCEMTTIIKGWSFQDQSTVPQQAADVLAYEVFKQVTNQILDKGKNYDAGFSMKHLVRARDDRYLKYWGEQRLFEWIKESNLRHPRLV